MNKLVLAAMLLVMLSAGDAMAQRAGRGAATQSAAPDEPSARGRRGGGASSTPAVEGAGLTIDETPVITHHELKLEEQTLKYTATAGQMPLKNAAGDTEAHIFYMAYTVDDSDHAKRPLTFAFNGGPGSASVWVHMGAMGPRRTKLLDNGDMPPPPFSVVDNEQTWLGKTDLVFIDPVGTGYSRAKSVDVARRMNGVEGDLQSIGEFIRMYLTRNDRWLSPLFIAGESYGTFRAAGLAGRLDEDGIAVNGVILISTVLNFGVLRPSTSNNIAYALHLPTYTADAFYHKKLPSDLDKDLPTTLKEVEGWAMGGYLEALDKGDTLTAEERKATITKLARYTGLEERYLDESEMRLDVSHFTRQLLRDKKLTIGRYDGRMTGPSPLNAGEVSTFDPSGSLTRPPFTAAFMNYVRTELNYKSDMEYYILGGGIQPWDWGAQNNFADATPYLRTAFQQNPHMRLMVCASYYDLATPYFAAEYTINHMGLHQDMHERIKWSFYEAGHMMYIDKAMRVKLTKDVGEFMDKAVGN
ncbi:MAG TPA: hypothetical protein VH370_24510 [Humisphaera sp.]|jgi:carboxypeptidase C (cathepsin A)|nr:hypothetical protein [Humisphaera sp.]